jgi:hypothetical protein
VLIDSNESNIAKSKAIGLEAINTNIYSETLQDNIELNDVGYLMALTGNPEINNYAINKFKNQFGENGSFRLVSPDEIQDFSKNPKAGLFSHTDDFISLTETARNFPVMHEIVLDSKAHYDQLIEKSQKEAYTIPIFIKDINGNLEIISSYNKDNKVEKGYKLVYLGKPLEV